MTMQIAIASGKGGTGKTTLATSLAVTLAGQGEPVAYIDCDVEEPNGHIFLRPEIERSEPVHIPVPEVDSSRCLLGQGKECRACSQACRFSAILALKDKVLTFPKLCHGCGGCAQACPAGAIREVPRPTGTMEIGRSQAGPAFVHGILDIGEAMAPPVIREVLRAAPGDHTLVIDAPPGTSCPVIEAIHGADVVLLVTEPTPFGLNDLRLAVDMTRALGRPFAVAINRADIGDDAVLAYCREEDIPVVLEIPDDRRVAEAYSRGELAVDTLPGLRDRLGEALGALRRLADQPPPPRMELPPPHTEIIGDQQLPPPSEGLPPGHGRDVTELVIISGKGGTGKTSVTASFFALARHAVVADCDVDAADLHLVLEPDIQHSWPFSGGSEARIIKERCTGCGLCVDSCRFDALHWQDGPGSVVEIDPIACEACGVCVDLCPEQAAVMEPSVNGSWFLSDTRHGPMVHARLGIAQENSGKLVTLVRREARAVAEKREIDLLLVDGSPGIGCPVIASITGAQAVLVVCEPTLSGLHDMRRVAELARHFQIQTAACINKADINPELAARLEQEASELDVPVLGQIRYDPAVTRAQVERRSVVEAGSSPASDDIRALWEQVCDAFG